MTAAGAGTDGARVIAIGASAGGVEALIELIGALPARLGAAVLVVLHVAPAGTSVLPCLLSRRSTLPVRAPDDREPMRTGTVYVAPPDRHLLLDGAVLRLTRDPPENGHRPALDPTFRSIAHSRGARAVGVVLSGTRADGAVGLWHIHAVGGVAIVQDPAEAQYDGMPRNALRAVPAAEVLRLSELAERIAALAGQHRTDAGTHPRFGEAA